MIKKKEIRIYLVFKNPNKKLKILLLGLWEVEEAEKNNLNKKQNKMIHLHLLEENHKKSNQLHLKIMLLLIS